MSAVRVRFFASLRERLGSAGLDLDPPPADVASLVAALAAGPLPRAAEVLLAENVVVAVNQTVAARSATLEPGDEVAFYPPVTGG